VSQIPAVDSGHLVEAVNVIKHFGHNEVLKGVDLTVDKGEVVCLLGPSGSGKTTFLRCLNFLEEPTSGRIKVGDIEIDTSRPLNQQQSLVRRLRQHVGFVFQNFNLFPHRTALENVVEGPIVVKKTPPAEAIALGKKLLARVGLSGKEDAYPRRLSGGQQQRVAIARALVNDPLVILADEPTGNLDSKSGKEILALFDELHQQGKTLILVTHDQKVADRSFRAIRLCDGQIESDIRR